jgi:hypothetical protein
LPQQSPSLVCVALLLPSAWSEAPVLPTSFLAQIGAVCASGLLLGSTFSVCLELAAQITFPVSEGLSGNVLALSIQLGSLCLLTLGMLVPVAGLTLVVGASVAVCFLLTMLVSEQYLRAETEEQLQVDCDSTISSRERGTQLSDLII